MKVVILPGETDEGGPPTLLEIEEIENRYQLQSEAKAEYSALDRALSMRRKIESGMTLEQQLGDDPIYAGLEAKKFTEEVKKCEKEFLKPLECIERYLARLGREGLYSTVSRGLGDSEGRWQAFHDYYSFVYLKLEDEKKRIHLGISEDEIGRIEDVAFKIIRKREFKGLRLPKPHKIIRDLPKWLGDKEAKKELLKLVDVPTTLPAASCSDASGKEYDERMVDEIWGQQYATDITRRVKNAMYSYDYNREQETPVGLLEAALKKLKHERMDPTSVNISDYSKAMKIARAIQARATELENQFYLQQKKHKQLIRKYKRK